MEGVRVHSWTELLQQTAAEDVSFNSRLQRFRSPFAFRGISADWPLTTGIQRLKHDVPTLRHIEKAMFRNFKKYAYADFDPASSDWKWLALAQHHGLPTRLLDWTFSPFVAMHFATNELDKMDKDGVLWMVNFEHIHKPAYLPTSFRRALERHFALTFSVEMLEEDSDLRDPFIFDDTEKTQKPFVIFFEPPSLDPRIVNQWGLFSLMNQLDLRVDTWLADVAKNDPKLVRKIVIDADAKWEIRDRLDGMNLTERVMMPGLDGLSTWLKRWYSPKSPHPIEASEGPQRATIDQAPAAGPAENLVVIAAPAVGAASRQAGARKRRVGGKASKQAAVIAARTNRTARGRGLSGK